MWRRLGALVVAAMGFVGSGASSALAVPTQPLTFAPLPWGCHGHANTPHAANDQYGDAGIGYDGYMDCTGGFGAQRVCVKLQELDYYGEYYDRTGLSCNAQTVAPHAYVGRWVSCVQAGVGTYRTYFQGTAYPPGELAQTRVATSSGASFCSGYFAVSSKIKAVRGATVAG